MLFRSIVSGKINNGNHRKLSDSYNEIVVDLENDDFDITNLLHYYIQIKNGPTSSKAEITVFFKDITDDTIRKLLEYFEIVQNFKKKYNVLFSLIHSLFNRKQLWPLIYGSLLYCKNNDNNNQDRYIELFNFILMFSFLELNLLNHSPGGVHKRIINKYIIEVSNNGVKKMPENFIVDELKSELENIRLDSKIIKENFSSLDDKLKKSLFVYYFYINNKSVELSLEKINLEHIFPQKPNSEWMENGWKINELKNDPIHSFGNLILLNDKLNKKIKNGFIDKKIPEIKKFTDQTLMNFNMNKVDWDRFKTHKFDYIEERSNKIIEELQEMPYLKGLLSLLK